MKKKLVLIFVIIIGISGITKSQKKAIYMVAGQGCPANCLGESFAHYPVHLFKVNKGKLEKILDISSGDEYVFKIGQYNAFKKVIIYKSPFREERNNFIIIDYSSKLKIDTISRKFSDESFSAFTYYIVNLERWSYIIFEYYPDFYKKFEEKYFYGINLVNKTDTLFDNSIIQHLHSEGEQGIALVESTDDNSEIMKIRTKVIDNKPYYYILYPRLSNQDTAMFNIPELDKLSKQFKYIKYDSNEGFFVFTIINKNIICLCTSFQLEKINYLGSRKIQFYNYVDGEWRSFLIKGIYETSFKQIREWIVGYEAYSDNEGFYQKIEKYGSIPGKKYRRDTSMYGKTFDERALQYKFYPEGVLYIYNISTGKYIEWEALEHGQRQGDSEVLYIEDDMVFYRINDKIYKAKIINGEKLGKSELVVKDERIPDVHWLFLAEE